MSCLFQKYFWLFVIIEHNLVLFSIFVLSVFVIAEARVVLKMFLFGPKIEARCSYKIVPIKKKRVKYTLFKIIVRYD